MQLKKLFPASLFVELLVARSAIQRYEKEFDVYLEFSVIQMILHRILHNPSSCAVKTGSIEARSVEAPQDEKARLMPCFNIVYCL